MIKKLYKYRSLSTDKQLKYALDILTNNRLYASSLEDLNDPMEGFIVKNEYHQSIKSEMAEIRIVSLANSFNNMALWAHYADDFKGICIECELNDDPKVWLKRMEYDSILNHASGAPEIAWPMLMKKWNEWRCEEEWRVLLRKKKEEATYFPCEVTGVYLGKDIDENKEEIIRDLANDDICMLKMEIGDDGLPHFI